MTMWAGLVKEEDVNKEVVLKNLRNNNHLPLLQVEILFLFLGVELHLSVKVYQDTEINYIYIILKTLTINSA